MIHYGELNPFLAYFLAIIPVMISALLPALFGVITARLIARFGIWTLIVTPLVWVITEFLRFHLTGMGWNLFGYVQSFHPSLIWPARFGGVYLVSALTILPAAAIAWALHSRKRNSLIVTALALLLTATIFFVGTRRSPEIVKDGLKVVAVQASAPVSAPVEVLSESLGLQLRLTREGLAQERSNGIESQPILVIWPEAPYNFRYDLDSGLRKSFGEFAQRQHIYLMFNSETDAGGGIDRAHTSVVVVGPNGDKAGQYDKIHLLPFGEYVPMRDYIPFIDRIPSLAGDYIPADKYGLIKVEDIPLGASICFEAVFPDVSREQAKLGAQALINIADDAWFGPTPITRQHLAHAVMRAVETGLPLLRVANTGITAYIAPDGQVSDMTPIFESAVRHWQIDRARTPQLTFYTRYGDLFVYGAFIVILSLLAVTFKKVPPVASEESKEESK